MRHSIETNPPKELVTVKLKAVREHRGYSKNRLAAMAGIQPGAKIACIGSECFPFIKTGGLGDVMYALPRALLRRTPLLPRR